MEAMVRPVSKADREAVGRLWWALVESQSAVDERFAAADDARQRWENDFPQWLQSETRKLYVAVDDGTICGFVTAERWAPAPIYRERPGIYVNEIYVDAAYRRRGHGRSLVGAVRAWGERIGAREIRAGVLAANETGRAFWKEVGGSEIVRTFALVLDAASDAAGRRRTGIGFRF